MKHHAITTAMAISGLLVCSAAAQNANLVEQPTEHTFAMRAAQTGMAEVELGRLAAERAANEKVKQFGQRMVDDHTKAKEQLRSIAAGNGPNLPTALDVKDEAIKTHLSSLSGTAFDRAYIEVTDHRTAIAAFEYEANHGSDPDMKNFAEHAAHAVGTSQAGGRGFSQRETDWAITRCHAALD